MGDTITEVGGSLIFMVRSGLRDPVGGEETDGGPGIGLTGLVRSEEIPDVEITLSARSTALSMSQYFRCPEPPMAGDICPFVGETTGSRTHFQLGLSFNPEILRLGDATFTLPLGFISQWERMAVESRGETPIPDRTENELWGGFKTGLQIAVRPPPGYSAPTMALDLSANHLFNDGGEFTEQFDIVFSVRGVIP